MTSKSTTVTVPAEASSTTIIRVVAADAAAAADLGFDRYSDLELAVSEAASLLLAGASQSLRCELEHDTGRVQVRMEADASRDVAEPDELAMMVLEAVAGHVELTSENGRASVAFAISDGD